jgi:2-dehydropantoate 2-reductase
MRVLVVGTGAVGGTFGAKLALAGHEVTLVARGAHGTAIREHGLRVSTPEGELVVRSPVLEHVDEAEGLGVDVALIAVKAAALESVIAGTARSLGPDGVAIPLLNGLGSERRVAAMVGEDRVVGGVAQMAASVSRPGHVSLLGGGMMTLAPLVQTQWPLVERIAQVFAESFPCRAEPDLDRVLWHKLMWNGPFNGICALTRLSPGQVLALPELEELVRDAMQEVILVANASGVALDDSHIAPMLTVTRKVFADAVPSMLQDVLAGRPTEAGELQGAVASRGQEHAIPTPIHRTLFALLSGLDATTAKEKSE